MARIKNVELPNNKKAYIGLTHIYGIGRKTAKDICKAAKVDENKKVGELSNDELASLRVEIDKYVVEGDLRREVQMNIKNKKSILTKVLDIKKVYQYMVKEQVEMLRLVKVKVK